MRDEGGGRRDEGWEWRHNKQERDGQSDHAGQRGRQDALQRRLH